MLRRRSLHSQRATQSKFGTSETKMGAKLYLLIGLGCAILSSSSAASAKRPVEPKDKEVEVANRLNKRTKQSIIIMLKYGGIVFFRYFDF